MEMTAARTAVIVVDMQHDFASIGGMFERAGIDVSGIRAIVEPTRAVLDVARGAGMLVCYLKMGFDPDLANAGYPTSPIWMKHAPINVGKEVPSPTGEPSRILIRDTWNTDIIEELAPKAGDLIVEKHRYSGFHDTELEALLREHDIESLVFVGATTCVCVEYTLRDAVARDFHCLLVEDCVAEPIGAEFQRTNHEASLLTMERLFCSITDSTSLIDALSPAPAEAI
ncbi:MAG: ureidoacrylate peracid hydrolase [Ilumatobacteraceae bacterium]